MKKVLSAVTVIVLAVCLAVTSLAMEVPSIHRKDPEIIPVPGKNNVYAEILDNGVVVKDVPREDIIITPLSDIDNAANSTIREQLEGTCKDIEDAKDLGELVSGLHDLANEINPGSNATDFDIIDIVNLYLPDSYDKYFQIGNLLRVTIDFDLDPDEPVPTIGFRNEKGEWCLIDADNVIQNADGTLTLLLPGPGTLALLKLDIEDDNGKQSPQTGSDSFDYTVGLTVLGLAMVIVVIACITARKKRD